MFAARAGTLDLRADMYENGRSAVKNCVCGTAIETLAHFLFACPLQQEARRLRKEAGIITVRAALCHDTSLTKEELTACCMRAAMRVGVRARRKGMQDAPAHGPRPRVRGHHLLTRERKLAEPPPSWHYRPDGHTWSFAGIEGPTRWALDSES